MRVTTKLHIHEDAEQDVQVSGEPWTSAVFSIGKVALRHAAAAIPSSCHHQGVQHEHNGFLSLHRYSCCSSPSKSQHSRLEAGRLKRYASHLDTKAAWEVALWLLRRCHLRNRAKFQTFVVASILPSSLRPACKAPREVFLDQVAATTMAHVHEAVDEFPAE